MNIERINMACVSTSVVSHKMDATKVQEKLKIRLQKEGLSSVNARFLSFGVKHMNKNNLKIANVWAEKGQEEAVKQMFKDPEDGSDLSYAEMRSFYG